MCAQLGCRGDGGAEQENDIERVQDDGEDRVAREAVIEGDRDQVEQRQHAESRTEHVVVDHRRVAGEGHGDDVAHQRHHQQDEEEL